MSTRVSPKVHFHDLGELIDRLGRLHRSGGWAHTVAPAGDHFALAYSNGDGVRFNGEFTLPPEETEFLTAAITAGALSAQAVNSGDLRKTLLDFAAGSTGPTSMHAQLRIDRGVGRGS